MAFQFRPQGSGPLPGTEPAYSAYPTTGQLFPGYTPPSAMAPQAAPAQAAVPAGILPSAPSTGWTPAVAPPTVDPFGFPPLAQQAQARGVGFQPTATVLPYSVAAPPASTFAFAPQPVHQSDGAGGDFKGQIPPGDPRRVFFQQQAQAARAAAPAGPQGWGSYAQRTPEEAALDAQLNAARTLAGLGQAASMESRSQNPPFAMQYPNYFAQPPAGPGSGYHGAPPPVGTTGFQFRPGGARRKTRKPSALFPKLTGVGRKTRKHGHTRVRRHTRGRLSRRKVTA